MSSARILSAARESCYISIRNARCCAILTDCKAAQPALPSLTSRCAYYQRVYAILLQLHHIPRAGHRMCFQLMSSHFGTPGNEAADAGAKAAGQNVFHISYSSQMPVPQSEMLPTDFPLPCGHDWIIITQIHTPWIQI